MYFNPYPSYHSRLSCSPQPQCHQKCCDLSSIGGGYSSCDNMGKLASFACGNGSIPEKRDRCAPPRPPPPVHTYCPRPPPPLGNNCFPKGKAPSERLRNVDVQEELCYYVPADCGECCDPCSDTYSVCDCCGASELCPCECPGREKCPLNPVKYSRRQRFTFQGNEMKRDNFQCGPVWPFQSPSCPQQDCCSRIKDPCSERRRRRSCNSRESTACGKILPCKTGTYYFDRKRGLFIPQEELPKPTEVIYETSPRSRERHEKHLAQPQQSTRHQGPTVEEFEIYEEDKVAKHKNPEVVVQPIIQPVVMPNICPPPPPPPRSPCPPPPPNPCCMPCNPCFPSQQQQQQQQQPNNRESIQSNTRSSLQSNNTQGNEPNNQACCPSPNPCIQFCNPCMPIQMPMCNPFGNMCTPFGNMCNPMCNTNSCGPILPMCIPLCSQLPPPMPPPPPPRPAFPCPPPFPQMFSPMFNGLFGEKKKKKRKSKKRRSTIDEEEDEEDEVEGNA